MAESGAQTVVDGGEMCQPKQLSYGNSLEARQWGGYQRSMAYGATVAGGCWLALDLRDFGELKVTRAAI